MISALLRYVSCLDTHHRLMIALPVSIIAYFIIPADFDTPARITIVWVSYAMTVLSLVWTSIILLHPRDLPRISKIQDSSRTVILIFVVGAAVASLFAVIALLDGMGKTDRLAHILLAVLAVACAWGLVHTVFTIRYAHLYYGNQSDPAKRPGGLDFPHEPEPDYLDFAYFSFVIGMTSQVSDVAIGSRPIRRTALAHGVVSFVFNTIIIALTISSLSGAL
ncbi:DUF1345 domain-containing protein [Spirosoma soli]|uniref:DUF1345 domain-containing protein n=1 Tax=Spirosoma soli TaxID=1770529 RepID=A0ABW5M375_9BACT